MGSDRSGFKFKQIILFSIQSFSPHMVRTPLGPRDKMGNKIAAALVLMQLKVQ